MLPSEVTKPHRGLLGLAPQGNWELVEATFQGCLERVTWELEYYTSQSVSHSLSTSLREHQSVHTG